MLHVSFSLDEIFICDIMAVESRNTHLDYSLQNDLTKGGKIPNDKVQPTIIIVTA